MVRYDGVRESGASHLRQLSAFWSSGRCNHHDGRNNREELQTYRTPPLRPARRVLQFAESRHLQYSGIYAWNSRLWSSVQRTIASYCSGRDATQLLIHPTLFGLTIGRNRSDLQGRRYRCKRGAAGCITDWGFRSWRVRLRSPTRLQGGVMDRRITEV